jgi:ABC-type transport system involved in multi-copper enzyme maturation permease subunit
MWRRLFWKDWRVNRMVIAGGALLMLCPYASTLLLEYFHPRSFGHSAAGLRTAMSTAAMMALVITVLMSAVFGGVAFASERRERSAEFLAMLPVTRRRVLLTKLLFAAACVATMWFANVLVLKALGVKEEAAGAVRIFGPVIFMAFAVGWLCSTFLSSPGIAAGISIGVTTFSTWTLAALANEIMEEWRRGYLPGLLEATLQTWTITAGSLCLFVGSVYYLRRVEP